MNGRSLAALLLGLILGTGALAAPVPRHLFPKPQPAPKPEPSVVEVPEAAPLPQTTEEDVRLRAKIAALAARRKAMAEGTYVAPPPGPGDVILQTGRFEVGPPLPRER